MNLKKIKDSKISVSELRKRGFSHSGVDYLSGLNWFTVYGPKEDVQKAVKDLKDTYKGKVSVKSGHLRKSNGQFEQEVRIKSSKIQDKMNLKEIKDSNLSLSKELGVTGISADLAYSIYIASEKYDSKLAELTGWGDISEVDDWEYEKDSPIHMLHYDEGKADTLLTGYTSATNAVEDLKKLLESYFEEIREFVYDPELEGEWPGFYGAWYNGKKVSPTEFFKLLGINVPSELQQYL